jgi:galactonate dehydratase
MRIERIETITVGAEWKNWLFVRVHTDAGVVGVGEGTLNGLVLAVESCVHELTHLALGQDPRNIGALTRRLLDSVSNDGGHIQRTAVAAIEIACWDILGKALDAPVYALLGGKVRSDVPAYANGWYRTERTPAAFAAAAQAVTAAGLRAAKLDPFGTARGFISDAELDLALEIVAAVKERLGPEGTVLIDAHARFTEAEAVRIGHALRDLGVYWLEEPSSRERETSAAAVAQSCPVRIATGETFHMLGQFFGLARAGGVSIWQPEPMSLGGIGTAVKVAHLAEAAGAWIAPHQSGGPVATTVCLQLAAALDNFLIQEHFDPFNAEWTSGLVSWTPRIDAETGELSLPSGPGLGVELVDHVAQAHPYESSAYLDVWRDGWERRLGQRATKGA